MPIKNGKSAGRACWVDAGWIVPGNDPVGARKRNVFRRGSTPTCSAPDMEAGRSILRSGLSIWKKRITLAT